MPLAGEEEPKKEEGAEAAKEEPVKKKPEKPPVDYRTVKSGWVQRRGASGHFHDVPLTI